jgi:CPA2 family monovalent cation:H+ antiporter-2
MEAHVGDLTGIALVTAVAVAAGLVLQRLKQPAIVGYILAGVVLGPSGAGLVQQTGAISFLAELGVVLLLFIIGMELSLKAFVRVLRPASLVAAGQIAIALGVAFAFGWWLEWGAQQALLIGFIIAMSSTAVAMKMLDDIGELRTEIGQITVGVMIAQDIAIVPILILVNSLGGDADIGVGVYLKIAVAVGLLAGFIFFFTARPKITLPFAETLRGKVDLTTLASLAFCFTAASISGIFGMSPAYGAFLAGLVIANSTLRSEVIHVTEPIQSVLLVVFFLSIGLLIDIDYILANLGLVLLFVLGVIALKSVFNVVLLRATGRPWEQAFPAGLIMAQVGEFSFILAAAGLSHGAIDGDGYRLAIAVIAVSLLVSPFWMNAVRRFHDVAQDGITSMRVALSTAYAEEIADLERGAELVRGTAHTLYSRKYLLRLARRLGMRGVQKPAPEPQPDTPVQPEDAGPGDTSTGETASEPDNKEPESGARQ